MPPTAPSALNHFRSTDKKVCHHEHLTDEYRGPAHKACNLNYHTNVFLFNIKNYSHKLRNIQRCNVLLNIDLPRVNNFDLKQKMAWKQ